MLEVNFQQIATEAVSRGFAVIPLQPGSKDPDMRLVGRIDGQVGTGGAARRTRDLSVIAEWAAASPHANVGVCSDEQITILESDNEQGFRQLVRDVSRNMFGTAKELPETLTSQAREGRPHFFFRATAKTNSIEGAPGIQGTFEWRRHNQYVVGPGSLHPTGVVYQIVNNVPIVPMPDWLVDVLMEIKSAYQGETSRASKYVRVGPAAVVRDKLVNEYALDPRAMLADDSFEIHIAAGERHYFLQAMAGLLHDGERDHDELFEVLTAMRDKYCESGKGDYEIENLVQWTLQKDPCAIEPKLPDMMKNGVIYRDKAAYDAAPAEIRMSADDLGYKYPAVPGAILEFTLEPKVLYDGWFPRGSVSTVSGSSGTGKSRLMVDLLRKQETREIVLGHRGAGLRWLVIWADRGKLSNEVMLKSMGLTREEINIGYIQQTVHGVPAIREIKEQIENYEYAELPQVVFVEGGDMLIEENNKKALVAEFLTAAQRLAEHYHIALVFSTGAPKMNKSNAPAARRDMAIGSEQWGRSSDTMIILSFEDDGTGNRRKMTVQHRCAAAEVFTMEFRNGRLVEAVDVGETDDLWELISQQPGEFTATELLKIASKQLGTKRATFYRDIKRYAKEGRLAQRIDRNNNYLKVVGVKLK